MPAQMNSPSQPNMKRFLSRAEAVTLAGMALSVFSLFLTWRVTGPRGAGVSQDAIVKFELIENGFNLGLHWLLLAGAALSCAGLLFEPNRKNRLPLFLLQCAGGLLCFFIGLRYLAPLPGVLLDIVGAALLVFGAVDRFSVAQEPGGAAPR